MTTATSATATSSRQSLHTPTPPAVVRTSTQSTLIPETPPEEESHPPAAQRPRPTPSSGDGTPSTSTDRETPWSQRTSNIEEYLLIARSELKQAIERIERCIM